MEKTFLLGVGCQKGGTTWLHRYLANHPNVNMGFRKEYHVFDALFVKECRRFRKFNGGIYHFVKSGNFSDKSNFLRHRSFYSDINNYFDYFHSILDDSNNISLTGDITPSYTSLPRSAFELIKNGLKQRGIKIKIIFIMRDPVERCISAMRMGRRKTKKELQIDENSNLLSKYSKRAYEIRTQYEKTIKNLESVFVDGEIQYYFFESLFKPESIKGITDHLSIPYIQPDFCKPENVSNTKLDINEDVKRTVFEYYRDTYAFIVDRYGKDFISEIWPNYSKFNNS